MSERQRRTKKGSFVGKKEGNEEEKKNTNS
jgi:hypothetical protein